jgi:hypothetical protein
MIAHRSRFKAYLIDHTQLKSEAEKLKPYLLEFERAYCAGEISAAEWATLFVLLYLNERSSGVWWMKKASSWGGEKTDFLSHWLSEFQIKKIPDSVCRTLYFWGQSKYAIELKQSFITPREMLIYQAEGRRVVTLAQSCALAGETVDGFRDALEFLLHDLVHADLFFSCEKKFIEQKNFFSSILKLLERGLLDQEQKVDPQFQQDFNYLISDMNSHPAHLAAMLRASYIKHLLFREGKSARGSLSSESLGKLKQDLKTWQRVGDFQLELTNI